MKLTPLVAALAIVQPVAATAQSVTDTHELVWYPAGKTPSSTYRLREKPACVKRGGNDRRNNGERRAPIRCPATAETSTMVVPAK